MGQGAEWGGATRHMACLMMKHGMSSSLLLKPVLLIAKMIHTHYVSLLLSLALCLCPCLSLSLSLLLPPTEALVALIGMSDGTPLTWLKIHC